MKFITIKEAHNPSDLYVLKSKLESEGITCRLKDELSSQVLSHLPTIRAQLQIMESDAEKALAILQQSGDLENDNKVLTCPKCGSTDIKVKTSFKTVMRSFGLLISAAFLLKPMGDVYKGAGNICSKCGQRFSEFL